jgi:hypothetical protein
MCDDCRAWWLTPRSQQEKEDLRRNPYLYFTRMRNAHPEKALFVELALTMHACVAHEIDCERELSDVSRLVGKDRASLNSASIMALLLFYSKK